MTEENAQLCYSCYDHVTFQMHGYVPETFKREIKRYIDALEEDTQVNCYLCDRKVVYKRTDDGKWREEDVSNE